MKLYIAGPMSGVPRFNYPAFFAAASALGTAGYTPINPARNEGREDCVRWIDFMRAALRDVADADGIALLPGWEASRGASIERDLGHSLGLPVRSVVEWVDLAELRKIAAREEAEFAAMTRRGAVPWPTTLPGAPV